MGLQKEGAGMRYILWLPGYIIIGLVYFLPTEWGKKRNVSLGQRGWKYRNRIAPVIAVTVYGILVLLIFVYVFSPKGEIVEVNSDSVYQEKFQPIAAKDEIETQNIASSPVAPIKSLDSSLPVLGATDTPIVPVVSNQGQLVP